jgi:hypothetical protein
MALLFVGGVMNVLWIAAIAILVLAEKVVPAGRVISRTAGAGLFAGGALTAHAIGAESARHLGTGGSAGRTNRSSRQLINIFRAKPSAPR